MKFNVQNIFIQLNESALKEALKSSKDLTLTNSMFPDGKIAYEDGDYELVVESTSPIKLADAKNVFVKYIDVFAGKDVSSKISDGDISSTEDKKFVLKYNFKKLENIKESIISIMKNKTKTVLNEAADKPTFEISPNELLGKLHQAAMDQVEKKYGNVVSLFNTAIDTNQDPPMAALTDGMYKIKLKLTKPSGNKKKDKETTKEALKLYLTWFAGKDVARTADKPKWFIFKSKLDKAKEKNADGTQGYSVHYKMKVDKVDEKSNEKKADAEAAKESIEFKFDGCAPALVECKTLMSTLNLVNESNELTEKDDKKKKANTPKESGFSINPSILVGKLHEAAMQAMVKKYGKKCTIVNTAIDEDHKPPLCTTKPGQYKIIVKQLKKGLFGSVKAAKEAIRLYLTVFAGEDVAKDIFKAKFFVFGKSKFEQGKHEGQAGNAAGFTVYYQLDKADASNATDESIKIGLVGGNTHIVECKSLYEKNTNVIAESNTVASTSENLVNAIIKDDNVVANEILEKLVSKVANKRIADVLSK